MPILSESSIIAAKYALAVNKIDPSKYVDYHAKLMSSRGQSSKEQLIKFVEELGVDTVAVQAVVESSAIMQAIQNNQELARSVGISGTPAFVIGGQLVPGAIDYEEFKRIIKERRAINES
jgi:protein-disulfide isomerase